MGGGMMDAIKGLYGKMFDAIKEGDSLALSFEFAPGALTVSGGATVKPGSATAKRLASARTGTGELLEKLPADGTTYAYMDLSPEALAGFQKLGMSIVAGGKPSAELEKAMAAAREAGGDEMYTVSTGQTSNLTLTVPKDPQKALAAGIDALKSMKAGGGFIKDVSVEPKAETYKGFSFARAKMTFDLEKMVTPAMPGGVDAMKKMLGGDSVTSFVGTDGKTLITVTAKDFDAAKAQIDAVLSGTNAIGASAGFQALRKSLPKKASAIFLVSAQGLVKQVGTQVGAMTGSPATLPADMPKAPALFGGALVASPKGYDFTFIIPSPVGPVIEKGLVPMLQGMQGKIGQ